MVTATAILALSALMGPEPLAARSRHRDHVVAPPAAAVTTSAVPLPQPRPAEAPSRGSTETAKGQNAPGKGDGKDEVREEAAVPPPPSACRLALTDELAIAPSVPAIHGPGACGGDDLVRLEAVVLPDKTRVALTPPGIMRCTMATAVVNWIRDDVAPEVAKLGSEIRTLDNFDSYECRGRNGDGSARLSEHGHANAIDVHGFKLADGRMIELTDRTQPRELREAVLHSACTRFSTVLGPDSDWHHEDHIHVDLIERRNNYRICQWDVLDPMPKVAPLLPEVRPDDAPPREVAEAGQGDKAKDQPSAKSGDAKGIAAKNGDAARSEPNADGGASTSMAGNDKTAKDVKPDVKGAGGKAATATRGETSAPPKPAVSAAPAVKTPSENTAKDKPESRPAAESKTAGAQAAPDRPSADKPAAAQPSSDETATEKSSPDKVAADKAPPEKAAEKASRRKVAAEKPRRHRHRARVWNPFASFF